MSASSIKAGRAYVEIFTEDGALVRGLRKAQGHLLAWGRRVTQFGGRIFGGAAALTGPLFAATLAFAKAGDVLDKASLRTGLSVESLSELQYAAGQSGATFEELENGLRMMQKTIGTGGKKFEELAGQVGLPMAKLKALKPEDQFLAIADQIAKVEDPTKRAALAMAAFGKAGTKLLPLMDQGSKGIEALRQSARDLGLVMSGKDAAAAAAFGDRLDDMWSQLRRVAQILGAAVAPAMTTFLAWTQPILKAVIDWVDANRGLIANLGAIAAGAGAAGASLMGVGLGLQAAGFAIGPAIAGWKAFGSVLAFTLGTGRRVFGLLGTPAMAIMRTLSAVAMQVGVAMLALAKGGLAAFASGMSGALSTVMAMLTPIGVIGFALAAIGGYAVYASGAFQTLWSEGVNAFGALQEIAATSFGAIGTALANGNIEGAAAVMWAALQLAWVQGIRPLQLAWAQFRTFFLESWSGAVSNSATTFTNGWAGVETAWTHTIGFLSDSWNIFTSMMQKAWFSTVGFIQKAWVRLKSLFDSDINVEAEVDKINAETDANRQGVDDGQNSAVFAREQQRTSDLSAIEQQRAGAVSELDAMRQAESDANQAQFQASVDAADARLKALRGGWQASVDAANKAGQETPEARKREGLIATAGSTSKAAKEQVNTALEVGSAEALKAIVGATSPEQKMQKAIADATKRTADATVTTAAETKKLNRKMDEAPVIKVAST